MKKKWTERRRRKECKREMGEGWVKVSEGRWDEEVEEGVGVKIGRWGQVSMVHSHR